MTDSDRLLCGPQKDELIKRWKSYEKDTPLMVVMNGACLEINPESPMGDALYRILMAYYIPENEK